ncbi:acyl-CoA dehydrogenase [Candidatus Lokiarchaeum ossiferum]|uniref:acyl-CoA dehydrogenase n=1 Tax=Candidatus Lokiarchaeum ossiferum TaxID=2951803 RepID=UPI00352E185E
MLLLNPNNHTREYPDDESREIMLKTIQFFEDRGKVKLLQDDFDRVWYQDFLDFVKENKIFSTLLTPTQYGGGKTRWDTYRNCEFNEILGFYGLQYWYTWQVSILGLGPIWISKNEEIKKKTAKLLEEGGIFAFGLSEQDHGADIYSTDMILKQIEEGKYTARGSKYYIGNGNKAALVSIFGKTEPSLDPEDEKYGNYVFFAVNSQHEKYECVQNLIATSSYVAEYTLHDYPITDADILATGREAWDMTLNTVNIGKFNLGWASIGICTHCLYEAINHASHRNLFNHYVTDFPHIRQLFMDSYCRLVAMKLFALRGSDYMRTASKNDRRYLLYDPMVKMKVTTQGEEVVNLLWDIIAAKGFEKNMYFSVAGRDIRALPKLEGTVHVNMALIIKFMANYFFKHAEFPEVAKQMDPQNDDFLFDQGSTKGLSKIRFHDYSKVYGSVDLSNVKIFKKQIRMFKLMLMAARPTKEQAKDIDFLLIMGEMFTLIVYGQLIIENAKIYAIEDDLLDQIFDFIVRDFSKFSLQLYSKPQATGLQRWFSKRMLKKPKVNKPRFEKIWKDHVFKLKDLYEMKP